MTPTQKRVFNLLASAQEPIKVELSIIGDIQKLIGKWSAVRSKTTQTIDQYEASLERASSLLKEVVSSREFLMDMYVRGASEILLGKIRSEAKNLGIDPTEIKEYKELIDIQKDADRVRSYIDDLDTDVNQI
jgi:hypothetical protein